MLINTYMKITNPADNLLFATLNIPTLDKVQATAEILSLDNSLSFWDDYRHTRMFPLMTRGGPGRMGSNNKQSGEFYWLDHAPKIIVDWFEEYVFPWTGSKARVMALVTQPNISNYEHIDCEPHELNTMQHKMRIVIQGKTSTLYWITDTGNVAAPDTEKAFIMDGGWPHGMINTTNEIKVTLALGSPWTGNDHYDSDITILQYRDTFKMPDDVTYLWKK